MHGLVSGGLVLFIPEVTLKSIESGSDFVLVAKLIFASNDVYREKPI